MLFHSDGKGLFCITIVLISLVLLDTVSAANYSAGSLRSLSSVNGANVLLQSGSVGTSIIYVNSTSASTFARSYWTYYPSSYLIDSGSYLSGTLPASVQTVDNSYFTVQSGYDYKSASFDSANTTSSTSYVTDVKLTWTPPQIDNYLIQGVAVAGINSASVPFLVRLTLDGAVEGEAVRTPTGTNGYAEALSFSFVATSLPTTLHTATIDFAAGVTGKTTTISDARIFVTEIGSFYQASVNNSGNATTSTSFVNSATLSFTLGSSGNWLIVTHAEVQGGATAVQTSSLVKLDGTVYSNTTYTQATTADWYPTFIRNVTSLAAGSHTINLQFKTDTPTKGSSTRNVRIYAINLSALGSVYSTKDSDVESASSTSSLQVTKVNLTWTPTISATYIIMATGELSSTSATGQEGALMNIDGVLEGNNFEFIQLATASSEYRSFAYSKLVTLSASSHNVVLQFEVNAAGTAKIRNARIVAWQLPVSNPGTPTTTVEFTLTGLNATAPLRLNLTAVLVESLASVTVTIQLYNYTSVAYATSGQAYLTYTSSATPNTNETKILAVTLNPSSLVSTGQAKIKITGTISSGILQQKTNLLALDDFAQQQITYNPTIYNIATGTYVSGTVPASVQAVDSNYFIAQSTGYDYQVATNESRTITSSTTYVTRVSLTWTPPVADYYLISGYAELSINSASIPFQARLTLDGVTETQTIRSPTTASVNFETVLSFAVVSLSATSHTITLDYASGSASKTVTIQNARIFATRIGALNTNFYQAVNNVGNTTTSSTFVSADTLTFTPAAATYLIISYAEVQANHASVQLSSNLLIDGTTYHNSTDQMQTIGDSYPTYMIRNMTLTSVSHTIQLQLKTSGFSATIQNARIFAINLNALASTFQAVASSSSESQSTSTSTTLQTKATITFTPSAAADYVIFATGEISASTATNPVEAVLVADGTVYGNETIQLSPTFEYRSFGIRKTLLGLSAASHTISVQYATLNTGTQVQIRNVRLFIWRLPVSDQGAPTVAVEYTLTGIIPVSPLSLNVTMVGQYDTGSVNATIQLWNYNSASYATSGSQAYFSYISSGTPSTDQTTVLSVTSSPGSYVSAGQAKVKISGMGSIAIFKQKTNLLSFGVNSKPPYNYILQVKNTGSVTYNIRLKATTWTNIPRLANFTAWFVSPTSTQLIVSAGAFSLQTGPQVALAPSATIQLALYIDSTANGASTLNTVLQIYDNPATSHHTDYTVTFTIS